MDWISLRSVMYSYPRISLIMLLKESNVYGSIRNQFLLTNTTTLKKLQDSLTPLNADVPFNPDKGRIAFWP
jgi:hypothetical protein